MVQVSVPSFSFSSVFSTPLIPGSYLVGALKALVQKNYCFQCLGGADVATLVCLHLCCSRYILKIPCVKSDKPQKSTSGWTWTMES